MVRLLSIYTWSVDTRWRLAPPQEGEVGDNTTTKMGLTSCWCSPDSVGAGGHPQLDGTGRI